MSIKLVQYFVHDATINGGRVGGAQSLTISKNIEPSRLTPWGDPNLTNAKFIKKPISSATLLKILSDDYGPSIGDFNLRNKIYKRPVDKYDLGATIYGGGSIKLKDCVLTGLRYSFRNTGFFTEELSFEGTVSESTAAGEEGAGLYRNETGMPYKRQHYLGGIRPSSTGSGPLLSIEFSCDISYVEIPSYGKFKTYDNKVMATPVSCSVVYEVLDLGYYQTRTDYINDIILDEISYENIFVITNPFTINMGDKNVLVSIERGGAEAGDSGYSTLRYTYINTNNYIEILSSSLDFSNPANSQYNSLWD